MPKLARLPKRISPLNIYRTTPIATKRTTGRRLGKIRKFIAERDKYTCQKCGRVVVEFQIDHIVPLFLGGLDTDENRQLLCYECHDLKSSEEEKMRRG